MWLKNNPSVDHHDNYFNPGILITFQRLLESLVQDPEVLRLDLDLLSVLVVDS